MKNVNIVLSGLGGQGILFMTKVLAQAALDKGYQVLGAETHGMAQRGGSVISHLRLGEVQNSLVRNGTAHFLLSLDESEGYRNLPFLAPRAEMVVNTSSPIYPREEVKPFLRKKKIASRGVPAAAMARKMGAPLSANLVLLGYFSAFGKGPLSHQEIRRTIEKISPDRVREINLKVYDAGFDKGIEEKALYKTS
jgi:indolepyruvate ferredoxin oxidoreductase, beta subunit